MASPIDLMFWQLEGAELDEALTETVIMALMLGADGGMELLPPGYQGLLNTDGLNQAVLDYVKQYKSKIVDEVNRKTGRDVRRIYEEWILSGRPLKDLETKLRALNIFSKERAKRIAVTEITRLFADGNSLVWQAAGYIDTVRWNTARDDKTCPICKGFATANGGVYELNSIRPPAHPLCRCFLTPIVNVEAVDAQTRAILARRGNG